jgi:hypothetical protein
MGLSLSKKLHFFREQRKNASKRMESVPSKRKKKLLTFFIFQIRMDPLWLANSKLRRGKLDEAINICNEILSSNPGDQVKSNKFFDSGARLSYFFLSGSLAD